MGARFIWHGHLMEDGKICTAPVAPWHHSSLVLTCLFISCVSLSVCSTLLICCWSYTVFPCFGSLLLLVLECFLFFSLCGWVTWSQASVFRGKHFQSCADSWNDLSAQFDTISLFYSFVTSQIIWNSGPGSVCRVMRRDFNICWQDLKSWTNWCMNVRNFIDVLKVIPLVFCKNISNYNLKIQCMHQKWRQSTGRFCLYMNVFKL